MGAPFGVRGWVKLRSYTDPPERLLEHRTLQLRLGGAWRTYAVEASGRSGGQLTVKLAGVDDRTEAQALRARRSACRAASCRRAAQGLLPSRFDRLRGGESGGRRARGGAAFRGDAGARADGGAREQEYWVPAVPQHLRRVDLQARRVVVDGTRPAD